MLRNVFLKTLRDQRRALPWWGIGLLAIALYTGLLYPGIRQMAPEYDKLLKTMQGFCKVSAETEGLAQLRFPDARQSLGGLAGRS